jgi:hypothetical protein
MAEAVGVGGSDEPLGPVIVHGSKEVRGQHEHRHLDVGAHAGVTRA